MYATPQPQQRGRGAPLLIAHCTALSRLDDFRPTPVERLEALVGDELTRFLLDALATPHGATVSRGAF